MNKKKLNKNLVLLLFGRVISDIGSSIQMLIMPLYIIDVGGSAATIGLFSFLSLMPILIVYPFAGVIGDRLNRKRIMVIADVVSAVVVLLLAYVSSIDQMSIALLLMIQVIVALMYGFFDPATKGMIPQLVPEDELNKTNSKVATLRILSGLVAPLIAVALYTSYGITLLFIINGISFLISGSSEMLIRYQHTKKVSIEGFKGILHDMTEGAKFIKHNAVIRRLSTYFLVIFAFIHPVFSIVLPLFFRTQLNYTDTQYGYIQVILFSGAMLGSILVGRLGKDIDLKKPMFMGIISMSVTMIVFGCIIIPSLVTSLGNSTLTYFILFSSVLFLLYTSIMFINIPVQTFIQKVTPNEYMSRVFSIVGLISKGGMPLGALIYGMVLDKVDIHITVIVVAIIIMIVSIRFIASFTTEQRLSEIKSNEEV
ncbi:MFS transporter [Vallitalea okinawensis]|uniref:MFS transporter n=1 Tax=Vallitalea okinawensis TaxID=2078660 RepID=UPI002E8E28DB|nr:MFS transporter [Vallitalea okinawensis]